MDPASLFTDSSSQSEPELTPTVTPSPSGSLGIEEGFVSVDENAPETRTDSPREAAGGVPDPAAPINLRAYQQEMLHQSLSQNVIVAMDTGSGKTQVAILRIRAELEKCSPDKIVWFLAPTIALCTQQHTAIGRQIRSANMKLLTGNDNLCTWEAKTWEVILDGVHIVVSTFQVLLDALASAFIKMDRLSLLVFDEAHNCVRKHAGSKIMKDFYHRDKESGSPVPSILGLTASPSMRSHLKDLMTLEATLDARCISPTIHRGELIKHSNRPRISHIEYSPLDEPVYTKPMLSLDRVYKSLDIREDPRVLYLLREPTEKNLRHAEDAIRKKDTFSQEQLKGLLGRAVELSSALGSWAADRYLSKAITSYLSNISTSHAFFGQWRNEEKRYLARELQKVHLDQPPETPDTSMLSEKVKLLTQELLSVRDDVLGIIFVKERATVTMLKEVLETFPALQQKFETGVMVGESNCPSKKRNLYDFVADMDLDALKKFRSRKINLLIATSVLEEGIDVPACNLVICFDQPANSKSFIQRRGRARMQDSQLILFFEKEKSNLEQWLALEEEMRKLYQDEQREAQRLAQLEEAEGTGVSYYVVESTGARLDFDNAKQRLGHFCAVLSQSDYVDKRPDYIIRKVAGDDPRKPRLSATVVLPVFLPAEVRRAESASTWLSEKNATKDAAFQAYLALYRAKFINDHLLPFGSKDFFGTEGRQAIVDADQQLNPWIEIARLWAEPGPRWLYDISQYDDNGEKIGEYGVLLPKKIELPQPIRLYIDHTTKSELHFTSVQELADTQASSLQDHTSTLLALHYNYRWPVEDRDHVIKIMAKGCTLTRDQIGSVPFDEFNEDVRQGRYLIRDPKGTPYTFESIIPSKPPLEEVHSPFRFYEEAPDDVRYLVLKEWTRRSDFLHSPLGYQNTQAKTTKPYKCVLPITWATVDAIPAKFTAFGMLIPAIIHELEVALVTNELVNAALAPLLIKNHRFVREAITSRSAGGPSDYERFEFFGDSLLKYCTAVHVFSEYTNWHEGYLSFKKDSIVSNSRLCRATIESGLAKSILAKAFTGQKWRPLYLDDLLQREDQITLTRKLSTKTLADVVEALIGAAYQDGEASQDSNGGIKKTIDCMSLLIRGDIDWQDIQIRRTSVFDGMSGNAGLPKVLEPVEDLLGHSFLKKGFLIEAMTHASYVADTEHRSLDRLEFLGDAVLDYIIVTKLFSAKPAIPNYQMHLLKTAMVNGEFLAFICLEHSIHQKQPVVLENNDIAFEDRRMALWQFMRHAASGISIEQEATVKRYELLRDDIVAALQNGAQYPWALLARLRPNKFFADLIEALLGAVWLDKYTSACEDVLHHLGIMQYLDRFLGGNVNMMHPKEELGVLAVTEKVVYDVSDNVTSAGEGDVVEYNCKVIVGDRVVADLGGGLTREETRVMAAEEAVRVLKEEHKTRAQPMEIA